jgi:hypothetical protein
LLAQFRFYYGQQQIQSLSEIRDPLEKRFSILLQL